MQYCPACGKDNPDDSKFCMNCGASLPEKEYESPTKQSTTQQTQEGYLYREDQPSSYYRPPGQENVHPLAYLCACCVPIAGFVIWLVVKEQNPESANTILIISIISLVFSFFLGLA